MDVRQMSFKQGLDCKCRRNKTTTSMMIVGTIQNWGAYGFIIWVLKEGDNFGLVWDGIGKGWNGLA